MTTSTFEAPRRVYHERWGPNDYYKFGDGSEADYWDYLAWQEYHEQSERIRKRRVELDHLKELLEELKAEGYEFS